MNNEARSILWPYVDDECTSRARRRKLSRNYERAMALEQAMFDWRSRHLILVLTLTYLPEWRPFISFADIQNDRDHFFGNIQSNSFLQGIHGYIWVIEEGGGPGGLHMHVVLFYDGASHADVQIAKSIGEYWVNVATQGRGMYRNHNAYKQQYERGRLGNATGQVDRGDVEKRESLRTLLGQYIVKDDQPVSSRTNQYSHTFGTSHLP